MTEKPQYPEPTIRANIRQFYEAITMTDDRVRADTEELEQLEARGAIHPQYGVMTYAMHCPKCLRPVMGASYGYIWYRGFIDNGPREQIAYAYPDEMKEHEQLAQEHGIIWTTDWQALPMGASVPDDEMCPNCVVEGLEEALQDIGLADKLRQKYGSIAYWHCVTCGEVGIVPAKEARRYFGKAGVKRMITSDCKDHAPAIFLTLSNVNGPTEQVKAAIDNMIAGLPPEVRARLGDFLSDFLRGDNEDAED